MKIKNLLLLGLLTVCCNAFAQEKKDGIWYTIASGKATVTGISSGMKDASTITIPASFVDGDGNTVAVTGFAPGWTAWGTEQDVTGKTTKVVVNIDNFTAGTFPAASDFSSLTKLATLELKGTSTIDGDVTVPDYTKTLTKLETLDLDALAAKTGKKVILTAQTAPGTPALKTVTLSGVDLPKDAFNGQTALVSVTGAKNVGQNALKGATALATFTFTGTEIGANAFDGDAKLTTIDLSAVTTIGDYAFKGTKITTANLAAATVIGEGAFQNVATITSVTLNTVGDKTTKKIVIDDYAFDGLGELTELTIPATVTYAKGASATDVFANMAKLATLTINNDVIPAAAFTADNAIATLNIKNAALKDIPFGTFTSTKIVALDLSMCPNLVVAPGAFPVNNFTKLKLSGSKTPVANFNLPAASKTTPNLYLKTLTLSATSGETLVGGFAYYAKLANVSLPATISLIDDNAFQGSALTEITIPEGCSIGNYAFAECADLATVTFLCEDATKAKAATIGINAFEATAVAKVIIPANVTSLGADAFKNCALLKRFQANSAYDETAKKKYGLTTIPAAFDGCDKLSEVVIPKTVTTIAANAFKDHAKLATVTFKHEGKDDDASNALWSIGTSAFEGTAITTIDLSMTQLTSLSNDKVFKDCASLATITLPEEMNWLNGNEIFAGTAIETLDASMVDGSIGDIYWDTVTGTWSFNTPFGTDEDNPNNTLKVLKVGDATIYGDNNTSWGLEFGAFAYCTKLKTVITGAATILPNAFAYDQKLATVTVTPYNEDTNTKASISKNAFDHCSGLTTFDYTPENLTPTNFGYIHGQAFTGCTPFVEFITCQEFRTWYENEGKGSGKGWGGAPINTAWTADLVSTIVKTVQDKANPNQFIGRFVSTYNAKFDANDAKLYSIYMDGETAYYQACRIDDGYYYVPRTWHVLVKTDEAKEVSWTVTSAADMGKRAPAFDDVESLDQDGELADIQTALDLQPGEYVYRFTNTEEQGFGFTYYSGKNIKANQFFVASTLKPEGAGRLNQVWLDEDGNVENNATAIQKIQNAEVEKGAVYNLQGVRVQKAQKGLYIQNGKKVIIK